MIDRPNHPAAEQPMDIAGKSGRRADADEACRAGSSTDVAGPFENTVRIAVPLVQLACVVIATLLGLDGQGVLANYGIPDIPRQIFSAIATCVIYANPACLVISMALAYRMKSPRGFAYVVLSAVQLACQFRALLPLVQ